ncbi:MAG TPA: phosphatase PAP2 family protein [Chloroflexota bacterium]|nr:phosphatase PAP2 family protein [Chloroflexota bacterium]
MSEEQSRRSGRFAWGVVIAFFLLLAVVNTTLTLSGAVDSWNQATTQQIYQLIRPWLNPPMIAITLLGYWEPLLAITLAVAIWAIVRGRKLDAWLLFGVYVVSLGLQELTKQLVRYPRPHFIVPPSPLMPLESYAYVSSHALQAISVLGFATVIACGLIGRRWVRVAVVAVSILLIAGIGFSRVYLGLHWVNDVLGGYLYGVVLLLVASRLHLSERRRS